MPTEIDWAQLAAYLDCEGNIGIYRMSGSKRKNLKHPEAACQVKIAVYNTDPRMIIWIRDNFGGSCHQKRGKEIAGHTQFEWGTSCREAERILRGCLPYFRIKKELAQIAIAFRETVKWGGHNWLSDDVAQRRKLLMDQFKTAQHHRLSLVEASRAS